LTLLPGVYFFCQTYFLWQAGFEFNSQKNDSGTIVTELEAYGTYKLFLR
jgi:hypothetical protein